jgi:hypothetical protein
MAITVLNYSVATAHTSPNGLTSPVFGVLLLMAMDMHTFLVHTPIVLHNTVATVRELNKLALWDLKMANILRLLA